MRPTITEQLHGLRRILADVVLPEVQSAYPSDVLTGVIANLGMLEHAWARVGPFLRWDNEATTALLLELRPFVDAPLATRIERLHGEPLADPLDLDALHARTQQVRSVLAEAIPAVAGGGERSAAVYGSLCRHLRERMGRYPLTMAAPMPSGR